MLKTLLIVLVIVWLIGMATSYTLGGFIHAFLIVAGVVILLRLLHGQSPW